MPNVMRVLRAEIRRLARKETRQEVASLRKNLNAMRRRVAESRRRIQELEAQAKRVGKRALGAIAVTAAQAAKQVRFSPAWVKRHRSRLGMSRRIYAKLLDVSPQTIMGWESGKTRPRRKALRNWRTMREKGVRELRALVTGERKGKRRGAAARKTRRKIRSLTRRLARGAAARRAGLRRAVTRRTGTRRRTTRRARARIARNRARGTRARARGVRARGRKK